MNQRELAYYSVKKTFQNLQHGWVISTLKVWKKPSILNTTTVRCLIMSKCQTKLSTYLFSSS
jgi:hypothetical protein